VLQHPGPQFWGTRNIEKKLCAVCNLNCFAFYVFNYAFVVVFFLFFRC